MIYDPLNSLLFFSLIQVVVFLFLHFHSPVLNTDRQDNRNYREIKFSTTSLPAGSAHRWMEGHVAIMCPGRGSLSSPLTSCDSWLKVGSSSPVVPDQPGETLQIHQDGEKRTWWHPPCHLLSQTDPCTSFLHRLLSACGPVTCWQPHQLLFSLSFCTSFPQTFKATRPGPTLL